ncbi:MAG: DUF1080 domain-containing protein [Isosphaeraceae bacterium]
MKRTIVLAVVFAAVVSPAPAQDQPIQLFNGKDLSGWTPVLDQPGADPSKTWSVADGLLKCTGKPVGYLKTDREFGDYVLRLEWRWPAGTEGGNNGVLVHATTPRALGIWPKSIEVQLFKGNAGDFWVIGTDLDVPDEATRKEGRRHKNLTDGSEKAVGEWNRMEITCKGDTIRVMVNGDLVNEATNCTVTNGAICLQSEGAPIEFRNLVLTPLKD